MHKQLAPFFVYCLKWRTSLGFPYICSLHSKQSNFEESSHLVFGSGQRRNVRDMQVNNTSSPTIRAKFEIACTVLNSTWIQVVELCNSQWSGCHCVIDICGYNQVSGLYYIIQEQLHRCYILHVRYGRQIWFSINLSSLRNSTDMQLHNAYIIHCHLFI